MTNHFSSIDALWTAPSVHRRGRPAKPLTGVQLRIESILLTLLAEGASLRMEELTTIAGYTAAQCRPVMQRLVASGVIRRTGNTRATRYQAVGL